MICAFRGQAGTTEAKRNSRESEISVCYEVDFKTGQRGKTTSVKRAPRAATENECQKDTDLVNEFFRNLTEAGFDLDNQTARTIVVLSVCSKYRWTPEATGKALEFAKRCGTPEARASFTKLGLSKMDEKERFCHEQMCCHRDNDELQTRFPQNDGVRERLFRAMEFALCALLAAQRVLRSNSQAAIP